MPSVGPLGQSGASMWLTSEFVKSESDEENPVKSAGDGALGKIAE